MDFSLASSATVTDEAIEYMKDAHTDSEWYVNPGESEKEIHEKRAKAEREGTLQESTWPNTKY